MKFFLFVLCLVWLTGCGKEKNGKAGPRVVYPSLGESSPPLMPSNSDLSEDPIEELEPQVLSKTVVEEGWMEKHLKKEAFIKSLREQRGKNPNDPFSLSEEEIEELSKMDNPAIF